MNPYTLTSILIAGAFAAMGFFVFFNASDRRTAWLWLLLTLATAGWALCSTWRSAAKTPIEGMWACRATLAFLIWLPVFSYHFICALLEIKRNRFILAHYLAGALFLANAHSRLFLSRVELLFGSYYHSRPGPLYLWFFIWWFGVTFHGYWEIFRAYPQASANKRNQIKYIALAMVMALSAGSLNFLPSFRLDVYPWANITLCLPPLIMSYALTRDRLLDITIILRQALIYSIVLGVLIAIYLTIVITIRRSAQGLAGYETLLSSLVAAGLVSVGFQPLNRVVQALMDKKFFRRYIDREEKLYELSREIMTHTSPEAMAGSLIQVLGEALHPKFTALYLKSPDGNGYFEVSRGGVAALPGWMPANGPLPAFFADHPQPFVHDIQADSRKSRKMRLPSPPLEAA